MRKETGGAAFPTSPEKSVAGAVYGGLSIRDYFAGQALMKFTPVDNETTFKFIAEWCYLMADAMLAERSKT